MLCIKAAQRYNFFFEGAKYVALLWLFLPIIRNFSLYTIIISRTRVKTLVILAKSGIWPDILSPLP